jgi:hypothetical protein
MAAPTLAQKKTARSTSAVTTLDCVFDNSVVDNALIVVFVATSENYSGLTISDSQANSYTLEQGDGYLSTVWGRIYTAQASSAGSLTITVNQSSAFLVIQAYEINGYDAAGAVEKEGKLWQTISSTYSPYSPLNFTATTAAEQLFLASMFWATGTARTWNAGTGWTQEEQYTGSNSLGSSSISKAVTSTGTYDPEWTGGAGSQNNITLGISIVAGSDGLPAGNVELAGAGTAGASGSATLTVQRNLAAAAVANALGSGTLSVSRPLTGAAIGAALGSATLTAFSRVWRVPTNAANGTAVHAMIMSGVSPNYSVLAQGNAVVAGGYVDLPGAGTPGTLAFAFVHNYNDNTATTSIRGGPAIATLTSI